MLKRIGALALALTAGAVVLPVAAQAQEYCNRGGVVVQGYYGAAPYAYGSYGYSAPAYGYGYGYGNGWRAREWREHEWREHERREHRREEWREHERHEWRERRGYYR